MSCMRMASDAAAPADPAGQRQRLHAAQNLGAVVEEDPVHHAASSARPVQLAARLDHQREIASARPASRRRARRSARPPGPSNASTWTPRASSILRRSAGRGGGGDHQQVVRARCAPSCESSGRRSCESITMRSSGRQRGRPRAVGEQAIVGQHRADAGQDGVVIVPQLLHVRARAFAGDPAAIVVRRGDLAVQRDRGLQRHQRPAGAHEVHERLVQLLGLGGELRRRSPPRCRRRAACAKPSPATSGLGSCIAATTRATPAGDQRVGAGRRAALVRAGLQGDVERRAARLLAGLFERHDLGVLAARRRCGSRGPPLRRRAPAPRPPSGSDWPAPRPWRARSSASRM